MRSSSAARIARFFAPAASLRSDSPRSSRSSSAVRIVYFPLHLPHCLAYRVRRCFRADACLLGALDEEEVAHLNEFCNRTQEADPKAWGIKRDREGYHINQGLIYSQPWLDNPELDQYAVNHRSFQKIVEAAMGGAQNGTRGSSLTRAAALFPAWSKA